MSTRLHETKTITIHGKPCDIDVNMIPVVRWLNRYAKTEYCCEGAHISKRDFIASNEASEAIFQTPYITWASMDSRRVKHILSVFDNFQHEHKKRPPGLNHFCLSEEFNVKTNIHIFQGRLRYCSRWYDHPTLLIFSQWLHENRHSLTMKTLVPADWVSDRY